MSQIANSSYPFKRNIYYNIEKALSKSTVAFLLGPRKCGKTVALLQFENENENAKYCNFKTLSKAESLELLDDIKAAMCVNRNIIYLLDEITYAFQPEKFINEIALQLSVRPCSNTHIVFTGSQSVALESWASRAFCGNASIVRTDFLNYSEWLSYKGIQESTETTYCQFLYEIDKFYGFISLEDYLAGCLEETIISNQQTDNVIMGNDVYLVNLETLLDICYATLFTLHNHVNNCTFAKDNKLGNTIEFYFRDVCRQLGSDVISKRIAESFIGQYNDFKSKDLNTLKQSFQFLHKIGLITITPVSDSVENVSDIRKDLSLSESRINYKDELFNSYNVCIKYPMFHMAILKEILKEDLPEKLPSALLGSIMECHVRGLLSDRGAFELHDSDGHEIDYVNVQKCLAIEISISNKHQRNLNFDVLPDYYKKVVLTKDVARTDVDLTQIPYHKFIQRISSI